MSDGDLVRQTLAGRASAYEELVRRWAPRIAAVCRAKVRRTAVAEELAQETLLRGYQQLKSLANPEKFASWLHSIAVRLCLDWLKAKGRTEVPFSALAKNGQDCSFVSPPDSLELDREDEFRQLRSEVAALPEEYRTVVLLFYYQELTYQDIAQMQGISVATVSIRLAKARALLRERFTRSGR